MCDCFGLKCAVKDCEEGMPIHISDFRLPRTVIKRVYCAKHSPKDQGNYIDYLNKNGAITWVIEINIAGLRRSLQRLKPRDLLHVITHCQITPNTEEDYIQAPRFYD